MPIFVYKAKTGPKNIITAEIEAENENMAISKITELGYFVISLEPKVGAPATARSIQGITRGKVRLSDVTLFTRQLSDLLDSGLTLVRALNIISGQTANKRLIAVIQGITDYVKEGVSFSEALSKYPNVFSPLYANMVKAGELAGALEKVLARLAELLESEEDLLSRVRAAMAYPLLMLLVGSMTIFVLMTFVIPKLVEMFEEMGQMLPLPTRILIAISDILVEYGLVVMALIVVVFFILRKWSQTNDGRLIFDKIKLSIPKFGEFYRKLELARFTRMLGTLLTNGVPILQSLRVVTQTLNSQVLKNELATIHKSIEEGSMLSKEISKTQEFPLFLSNMIAIGEESGRLDSSLLKIAKTYDNETTRVLKILTSLIEPLLILFMGSIVGFIVISMLLPIFQISIIAR